MNKYFALTIAVLRDTKTHMTANEIWDYALRVGAIKKSTSKNFSNRITESIRKYNLGHKTSDVVIGNQGISKLYHSRQAVRGVNNILADDPQSKPHIEADKLIKFSIDELLLKIKNRKNLFPKNEIRELNLPVRNSIVIAIVRKRANFCCELCDWSGFEKDDKINYIEVHHLTRLADGGADIPENAVALCPNCHRAMHYAKNRKELRNEVIEKLSKKGIIVSPWAGFD